MWELRSPSSWTLTFDRALIWSLVVVAETVRVGEAPLSTHSQRFIYGPLHFWLWWLQYLSSYLNCIFKDFIQYLHAIQYELSLFCLPTICFLFNCLLFWHVVAIIHKHACQICFRHKMLGMFPVKICFFLFCIMILMTAEHREARVWAGGWKTNETKLLDELNFITLCSEYK